MKKLLLTFLTAATLFVGCQKSEVDSSEISGKKMQTVTLSATMPENDDTRAAISSTGLFSWQENDQLSVLATDGNFYTLTLTSGAGDYLAEFAGEIPDGVAITTVAVYPAIVANGAENTIYDATTGLLNYTLPTEYNFVPESTNVPMVASLEEGATYVSFKQIGGVIRFPINALPAQAKIVFTAKDMATTGSFPITVANAGTDAIEANITEGTNSTVTVNYTAQSAGVSADINIPVPVGTYENFSIEVFDANDVSLFAKDYALNKEIKRATLLLMNAIDAGPMAISEVWPYFVDARVLFSKFSGASAYAFYVDDSDEPIILAGEEVDGNMQAVIGGDFEHGSTHTVAVAKVVNGVVDESSKSEAVSFTTGKVMQMTYNTGTKFVCAGWDDVALGSEMGTYFSNGKWPKRTEPAGVENVANKRGYRVQLYAADKTTLLYDEIPYDGQWMGTTPFIVGSSWGKIGTTNTLYPTSLTFGWLEPGKKYYFRVQTLAEPTIIGSEEGNSKADATISSLRGGSAWSNLVEMTTDAAYVMGDNDVFYEGFDDMMYNADPGNMSAAAIPSIRKAEDDDATFQSRESATRIDAWKALDWSKKTFSEQEHSVHLRPYHLGLTDDDYTNATTNRTFNAKAGSLKNWFVKSVAADYDAYPFFGVMTLGQKVSSKSGAAELGTPIYSDKLFDDRTRRCIVTVRVCPLQGSKYNQPKKLITLTNYRHDGVTYAAVEQFASIDYTVDAGGNALQAWTDNFPGKVQSTGADYQRTPTWFEVKKTFNLKNGDVISVANITTDRGMVMVNDIKIEIDPTDDGGATEVERVWGTAPDATNYDVWGLNGVMPVTFWMGPPALASFDATTMSESELATLKSTYFDPIVEAGYNLVEMENTNPASMKVLLDWCQAAGVRMIDKSTNAWFGDDAAITADMDRMANYSSHPAYAGAYVGPDEPGFNMYDKIAAYHNTYASRFPGKGRTVNLLPSYASRDQLNNGAAADYGGSLVISAFSDYVQGLLNRASLNTLWFDHYCLEKSDKNGNVDRGYVKSRQYYDLDVVRSKTLARRIPLLQITHGRPQWDKGCSATIANTDPTFSTDISATALPEKPTAHVYDEQRWLVWSQLALGSKGVSYFCYWTPTGFKGGPFSFDHNGNKTRMYDILKNINAEIMPIGNILIKCHADGAMMTNPAGNFALYENDGMGLSNYGPVLGLKRGNIEDVVAGCFRDATTGEYKVLVTHKAPATTDDEAATASIATLVLDTAMVTKVKLHTVTLANGHEAAATTVVSEVNLSGDKLTLNIPDGTAVLVEFPETAGQTYN